MKTTSFLLRTILLIATNIEYCLQ